MRIINVLIVVFTIFVSCSEQKKIEVVSTTETTAWQTGNNLEVISTSETAAVAIDRKDTLQTIEGFGGCFNELGWDAINSLDKKDVDSIMNDLFTPEAGMNFVIGRMPLGANDFSLDWYSYNEVEGDFGMDSFSIENDLNTLVPYIKEAQKYNPSIKIWASPWSPPAWMKWNKHYACATPGEWLAEEYRNGLPEERQGKEGTNMFIQKEEYFNAYALYFSKFIEAYRQQKINVSMVMPQNEFNSCQVFPSCTWTSSGLVTFIGDYLGPAMEKQGVEIMFGTMERPTEALVDTILNDPKAGKYVTGVGFQWAGKESLPGINKRYKGLKLYQTEQECGDGKNDWKHCVHSWNLMKHYLSNGVHSYLYWNIALKEGGVSRWGWSQNSLITINKQNKTFRYNHEYYLMRHFSHYVKPGAKLLKTSGGFSSLLAFENPDKSIVLIVYNEEDTEKSFSFSLDDTNRTIALKANSFTSIIISN